MINELIPANILDKLPPHTKVDLHIHTAASDGTWNPSKLLENIKKAGIEIFAVTDHDTTLNVKEAAVLARENQLLFVPGVEINAVDNKSNYHILGLGIDTEAKALQELLRKTRECIEETDNESIRYLEKRFRNISFSEFSNYCNDPERGGWSALNYLIDKGLCKTWKDFFVLFNEGYKPFDNRAFALPEEAIAAILEAGGMPVLAHPGASIYNNKDYKAMISNIINQGIRGIECYHPDNSREVTEYCITICNEYNLLITGGSDCHGEFVSERSLGHPDVRLNQLKLV